MKLSTIKRRFNKEFKWVTYPNPLIKAAPRIWSFILEYFEPKSNQVEAQVRLRCLNCGKPLKEYLLEDIEDETLKLPFCDDQCMDAYKDVDPNYFR